MTAAEKSNHYRMLNERFDGRSLTLRRLGFVYERITVAGQTKGVFVKKHPWMEKYNKIETAAMVMTADEIVWADRLEELSRPF